MSNTINYIKNLCRVSEGETRQMWNEYKRRSKVVHITPIREVLTDEEIKFITENIISKYNDFYKTAHEATRILGVQYVEGFVEVGGLPIDHAFNRRGDKYFDITFELIAKYKVKEYVSSWEIDGLECTRISLATGKYGRYGRFLFSEILQRRKERRKQKDKERYKRNKILSKIEILPVDFDLTLSELSEWHDKWRIVRFGSNDNIRYYQTDGRYLNGVIQDTELRKEKAIQERMLELLCRMRRFTNELKRMNLSHQERENIKCKRETLYKEFKRLIVGGI